jgi:hypothetical protein
MMDYERVRERDGRYLELRLKLARDILRSLDGHGAYAMRMLASALRTAEPPLDNFAEPFDSLANSLVPPKREGVLPEFQLACALDRAARHPDALRRLEGVEGPPWSQIRSALEELREVNRESP